MARAGLMERLSKTPLLLDGGMGTELIARSVQTTGCNTFLNTQSPEVIADIHAAYLNAGSDAVITNTFGGNKYALARHGHENEVTQINLAGAKIARKAAGDDKYVLGDIGPCGDFLEPLGAVTADELKAAFADQAKALLDGGVDGFIIETMTALDEVTIAIEAIKSVSKLPIFVSLAYDRAGDKFKTMMGTGPAEAVRKLTPLGIEAIGFNCGTLDMDDYIKLARAYASELKDSNTVLLAEPNAGAPQLVDDKAVYTLSAEDFADEAARICSAGARIIGGCCGTGPAHIKAMAKKLSR